MECEPPELLPIMPPRVARFDVDVSGPKSNPWGRTWWFSSSWTRPGCTRAHSSSALTSSTWFMCAEKSSTRARLTVWPVSEVPPPAREHGHLLAVRHVQRGLHVVGVARDDDADGLHLVHRGVGRVEQLGEGVETDAAGDDLPEFALEVVHGDVLYALARARRARAPPVAGPTAGSAQQGEDGDGDHQVGRRRGRPCPAGCCPSSRRPTPTACRWTRRPGTPARRSRGPPRRSPR